MSDTPAVIGHRGACGHAPENTLASIAKAAELGTQWVEFDVMLSRDDKCVLFHDDKLLRTTGQKGLTAETSLAGLQRMDAGSWFSDDFAGEAIPTLSEAMDLLAKLGLGAVVEIKPSEGRDVETGRIVSGMVRDHWPVSVPQPIISSFSEAALEQAMKEAPHIPRALNVFNGLSDWKVKLRTLDCVALHCMHTDLSEKTVGKIITAGYDLRCFTVNEVARANTLFGWGVCSVFSDFPERIMA